LGLGLVSSLAVGCGAGGAAEVIRPADPTASGALSEAECRAVDGRVEPLVVDWKPEQRGDLEVAMKDGVAVVAYDCKSFRLLPDCKIEGQYGFIGMTRKEQMVRLENSDEIKANLPLSGGQIGAGLSRDSTIDIAIVMVGKRRTTWQEPETTDLKGSCEGATHYVRGAVIGAFAMATGTKAHTQAAANLFMASAENDSKSGKETRTREGNPDDCAKAEPNAESPPAQCGAPIRLTLAPIKKAAAKGAQASEPTPAPVAEVEGGCPKGMVQVQGKCAVPTAAAPFQCEPGDAAGCSEQCGKGHAGSCASLGYALLDKRDDKGAADALKKSCDGDVARACVSLGMLTARGRGVAQDRNAAQALFEKGCQAGEAKGCGELGRARLSGAGQNPQSAAELLQKACNGGDDQSCGDAARLYANGSGVSKDLKVAAELHKRACNGTVPASCGEYAALLDSGVPGLARDPILIEMLYRRACFQGHGESCAELGRVLLSRPQGDPTSESKLLFERACNARVSFACAALKVQYGGTRPVMPSVPEKQALTQSCTAGNKSACIKSAVLDLAAGYKTLAQPTLIRICAGGDAWACTLSKAP